MINIHSQKQLSNLDEQQIFNIWNEVYPIAVTFSDVPAFQEYLSNVADKSHFISRNDHGIIDGWLMAFTRNDMRFFVLLVSNKQQNKGLGSFIMKKMMESEKEISGWVVVSENYTRLDGAPYISPLGFYKKLGFIELDDKASVRGLETVRIHWKIQ